MTRGREHDHAVGAGELVGADFGSVFARTAGPRRRCHRTGRGRCRGSVGRPSESWKSPVRATRNGASPRGAEGGCLRAASPSLARLAGSARSRSARITRSRPTAASDVRSERISNPASIPKPNRAEALFDAPPDIVVARRDHAAVLAGRAKQRPSSAGSRRRRPALPTARDTRPTPRSPPGRTRTDRRPSPRTSRARSRPPFTVSMIGTTKTCSFASAACSASA